MDPAYLPAAFLIGVLALGLLGAADAAPVPPALSAASQARFQLSGTVGERLRANERQWLLPAPAANPALLEMFRDRDRPPYRELLPWSGEFIGKYLTAAVLNWRLTRSQALGRTISRLVRELADTQSPEGYLGPFPQDQRLLVGWDLWGHYHALVGLLLWWQETGDGRALAAARKAGDFICATFPPGGRRVVSVGDQEMNEAIAHGLLLLYRATGEASYLALARRVEEDWQVPPSGDYVRTALAGIPFFQTPKPRWESLHDLQAIAELYWVTGDTQYRRACEHIWWSIAETDRHNTGGFSSGEQACGNPYHPGAIETCCTVAWVALSLDMLRLSGESVVADEIELATYNAGLGAQAPSGRWWTYNTPMEGERKASFHEIGFQCRPGSPELNCCSVNGPRLLGMVSQWALMADGRGLVLNYYGPGRLSGLLPGGERVTLEQETDYPRQPEVLVRVRLERPRRFPLRLRIPHWSAATTVRVNGRPVAARPGSYLALERTWQEGDRIELTLDLRLHFWVGERECAGKCAIYRGPLLLAYDPRFNPGLPAEQIPALPASALRPELVAWRGEPSPWVLVRVAGRGGEPVLLCDFASAGAAGTRYQSWLPVQEVEPVPFSKGNPLRSTRPGPDQHRHEPVGKEDLHG